TWPPLSWTTKPKLAFPPGSEPRSMSSVAIPDTSPVRGSMKPPPVTLQAAVVTPVHCPPEQVSGKVQALASSQGRVLFMCAQPLAGLQLSVVQTLLSSQLGGGPPTQAPLEQVSLVVQALLSLQAVPLGWFGFEHMPVAVGRASGVEH